MSEYARSNLANTFFGGKSQTGGGSSSIFKTNLSDLFKLITDKKQFFIMIFANLIVQIGITYYIMEKMNIGPDNKDTKNKINILSFVQIGLVLVLGFVPMPAWLKFIIFCAFSAIWGYMFSSVRQVVGEDNVKMAMMGTISIFALMFAFGIGLILSGIRLGLKFGLGLFYTLLFLLLVKITQIFIPTSSLTKKIIIIFNVIRFNHYFFISKKFSGGEWVKRHLKSIIK